MKNVKKILSFVSYPLILVAAAVLLIVASGAEPLNALSVFWNGIFGNKNSIGEVFVKATPLIFTGLACAVAFKTGFFNIGAEGQFYIGAVAASAIALRCDFIPPVLRIICAFAVGFIAGGAWSLIAALFNLPKPRAFLAVLLGVLGAGVIMCLASYGVVGFLKIFI